MPLLQQEGFVFKYRHFNATYLGERRGLRGGMKRPWCIKLDASASQRFFMWVEGEKRIEACPFACTTAYISQFRE